MNRYYNKFRRMCAWIIGAVFAVSGILKLMDYVGTGLIVSEYLKFLHVSFLAPAARPMGFILALAESVTGVGLMSGVWRKAFALMTSALMLFFSAISLLLVIYNPAMDCGCFGEAVHLTHMQTLVKNLILIGLSLIAFLPFRDFGTPREIKSVTFAIAALSLLFFGIISARTLPFKDFTPFRSGATIAAATSGNDFSIPKFDAEYIYEKDGVQKSFSMDDLPDSTWTFVEAITVENKTVKEVPVLAIVDSLGMTCDSLAAEGKVLVASVYDTGLKVGEWNTVDATLSLAGTLGVRPLLLVAGSHPGAYSSDLRTLVSLNRSNGGYTLIEDGMVTRKWDADSAPSEEEMKDMISRDPLDIMTQYETKGELRFQAFLLYVFAILILL